MPRRKPRITVPGVPRALTDPLARLLERPGAFALRVLRGFRANQGFLLASAVAFNTLLSILPLTIVVLLVLARYFDEGALLSTLARYLEMRRAWAIRGDHPRVVAVPSAPGRSWLGAGRDAAFLQLARVLGARKRNVGDFLPPRRHAAPQPRRLAPHPIRVSAVPCHGAFDRAGVTGPLLAMGHETIAFLGRAHSLDNVSAFLLYLVGVAGEILMLTSFYLFMPFGRPVISARAHRRRDGDLLWEAARHVLVGISRRSRRSGSSTARSARRSSRC